MANRRPIPKSVYYSGQGRVLAGERDATTGLVKRMFAVGNAPELEIQIAITKNEHKESMTGERGIDKTIITEKNATFRVVLESLMLKTLALAFWGRATSVAAGTVTNERVILHRGAAVPLKNANVSSVVVTLLSGAGGTPAAQPLAEAGNYDIDPTYGTLYISPTAAGVPEDTDDVGMAAQVSYSYGVADRLDALTLVSSPERFLRFEGLNTAADDGTKSAVLVEIPRASFDPLASLPLINEEIAQIELTGNILSDASITSGSRFYRQLFLPNTFSG